MAQYIDKSALVAEINKRIINAPIDCYGHQMVWAYNDVKDIINTLEVKEIDFNEEAKRKWDSFSLCYDESRGCDVAVWPYWVYKQVCKHFFKLGLNTSNPLTWEDIKEICDISFEVACSLQRNMHGSKIFKEQHYKEVLRRFKAQKGEEI